MGPNTYGPLKVVATFTWYQLHTETQRGGSKLSDHRCHPATRISRFSTLYVSVSLCRSSVSPSLIVSVAPSSLFVCVCVCVCEASSKWWWGCRSPVAPSLASLPCVAKFWSSQKVNASNSFPYQRTWNMFRQLGCAIFQDHTDRERDCVRKGNTSARRVCVLTASAIIIKPWKSL